MKFNGEREVSLLHLSTAPHTGCTEIPPILCPSRSATRQATHTCMGHFFPLSLTSLSSGKNPQLHHGEAISMNAVACPPHDGPTHPSPFLPFSCAVTDTQIERRHLNTCPDDTHTSSLPPVPSTQPTSEVLCTAAHGDDPLSYACSPTFLLSDKNHSPLPSITTTTSPNQKGGNQQHVALTKSHVMVQCHLPRPTIVGHSSWPL